MPEKITAGERGHPLHKQYIFFSNTRLKPTFLIGTLFLHENQPSSGEGSRRPQSQVDHRRQPLWAPCRPRCSPRRPPPPPPPPLQPMEGEADVDYTGSS